ncbi:DEAD/DEAH box helicase [Carnobacteriaceae bacterium zg-ZUI240]|nr:DEAD/DEAH box helicase [Carnobacteriaceae bacterium zg-ZUI240]
METLSLNQSMAIDKFKKLKVGALFMQQGSGKTRVAVELINSTDVNLAVFFCPFSTKKNLELELIKWKLSKEYMIIGYESISASDTLYLEILEKLKNENNVFLVADESIFIKNEKSKRFNRLIELSKHSEYRLILNGTPITKNEWDLYNQMYFLSPKIIEMQRIEFLNVFFKKIKYKKKGQSEREFYKLSEVNIDYLHKLIEPYIFNSELIFEKKENVVEISIDASVNTTEDYQEAKEYLLDALEQGECKVEMFSQLANICFSDKERHKKMAEHIKGQMIVFCTLLSEIETLSKLIDCYVITGNTKNRHEIIEQFKNDNKPLLITFGTGAFGLNLQFCNKIAFASLTFDYAKIDQAKARIKRIGQHKDIEYIFFTSSLGIFNMIKENVKRKMTLEELMITKIMEGSINECI